MGVHHLNFSQPSVYSYLLIYIAHLECGVCGIAQLHNSCKPEIPVKMGHTFHSSFFGKFSLHPLSGVGVVLAGKISGKHGPWVTMALGLHLKYFIEIFEMFQSFEIFRISDSYGGSPLIQMLIFNGPS